MLRCELGEVATHYITPIIIDTTIVPVLKGPLKIVSALAMSQGTGKALTFPSSEPAKGKHSTDTFANLYCERPADCAKGLVPAEGKTAINCGQSSEATTCPNQVSKCYPDGQHAIPA